MQLGTVMTAATEAHYIIIIIISSSSSSNNNNSVQGRPCNAGPILRREGD